MKVESRCGIKKLPLPKMLPSNSDHHLAEILRVIHEVNDDGGIATHVSCADIFGNEITWGIFLAQAAVAIARELASRGGGWNIPAGEILEGIYGGWEGWFQHLNEVAASESAEPPPRPPSRRPFLIHTRE